MWKGNLLAYYVELTLSANEIKDIYGCALNRVEPRVTLPLNRGEVFLCRFTFREENNDGLYKRAGKGN